jgi:hypothetical protein
MFGRMTATPLLRLDAGKSLEAAVSELLVTTRYYRAGGLRPELSRESVGAIAPRKNAVK